MASIVNSRKLELPHLTIPNYTDNYSIGHGAFGAVYSANSPNNEIVIIKRFGVGESTSSNIIENDIKIEQIMDDDKYNDLKTRINSTSDNDGLIKLNNDILDTISNQNAME
jgi:hypothetical protein